MEKIIYKEKEITFTPDMKFAVVLEVGYRTFGSLEGAKKAVDKELKKLPFKEFDVVKVTGWGVEKAVVVTIISADVEKRRTRFDTYENWTYGVKAKKGIEFAMLTDRSEVYKVEDLGKVNAIVTKKNALQTQVDILEKKMRMLDKELETIEQKIGNFIN